MDLERVKKAQALIKEAEKLMQEAENLMREAISNIPPKWEPGMRVCIRQDPFAGVTYKPGIEGTITKVHPDFPDVFWVEFDWYPGNWWTTAADVELVL